MIRGSQATRAPTCLIIVGNNKSHENYTSLSIKTTVDSSKKISFSIAVWHYQQNQLLLEATFFCIELSSSTLKINEEQEGVWRGISEIRNTLAERHFLPFFSSGKGRIPWSF
ncbi:hypothetical protein TNCV_2505501 [Trichonephila clavipes]|uniref:Uncharacterized protein n=1 Tax=Trichonephila clavipes TaxID=2585209 RepID=A0A8X7BL01_TRICX|nr:hypothetical protein TNCV_2505501 [Trichonephila clavipes]